MRSASATAGGSHLECSKCPWRCRFWAKGGDRLERAAADSFMEAVTKWVRLSDAVAPLDKAQRTGQFQGFWDGGDFHAADAGPYFGLRQRADGVRVLDVRWRRGSRMSDQRGRN